MRALNEMVVVKASKLSHVSLKLIDDCGKQGFK